MPHCKDNAMDAVVDNVLTCIFNIFIIISLKKILNDAEVYPQINIIFINSMC